MPVPDQGDLAPAGSPGQDRARRSRRSVLRKSLARFLTVEVAGATITVHTPAAAATTRSDRDGYVDVVVDEPGLPPGWHDAQLTLAGGTTVATPVLVVSPDVHLGLVSDVDDTILETGLTRGLEFLRITLLTEVTERALPGAAALYRALACRPGDAGLPVFYLTTSPGTCTEMLLEFIAMRGFPMGPLLLTDWGPGRGNLLRIGAREHKSADPPHPRRAPADGPPPRGRHRPARPRDLRHRGPGGTRTESAPSMFGEPVAWTGGGWPRSTPSRRRSRRSASRCWRSTTAWKSSSMLRRSACWSRPRWTRSGRSTRAGVGPFTRPSNVLRGQRERARHDGG